MMPDPALYADCLHQSFEAMKAGIAKQGKVAPKAAVAKPATKPKATTKTPAATKVIKPKTVKGKA
jgi:hypothetical protein